MPSMCPAEIPVLNRNIIKLTLIFCALLSACSGENSPMFRRPLEGLEVIQGELVIKTTDIYSIAIEAEVDPVDPQARQRAWDYLNNSNSVHPRRISVNISPIGGGAAFHHEAVSPELSSWSTEKQYIEIARVKLKPGRYNLRVTFSRKQPPHESFNSSLIVERGYQGK